MVGQSIGPYTITVKLGEGGMGEVYRARDTKLERDVAIKVLPATFASDRERVSRFEREAKTLAALNHPQIAQIYGFEQSSTMLALVMELVEGEDLAERVARGAIPIDEALSIARQIAGALEAAHDRGIVHRDLKPANIKVRRDGSVKVLDFGLAKALDGSGRSGGSGGSGNNTPLDSPTITSPAMTAAGMILGTAAYMSPEQAKGGAVDQRADVWAFGCVLFELITGRAPFAGASVIEVLSEVVKSEPNWDALPGDAPPPLRFVLRRCLEKDPARRLRDIREARLALDSGNAFTPAVVAAKYSPLRERLWRVAALLAMAAIFATAWIYLRPYPSNAPAKVVRFGIPVDTFGNAYNFAISPDGRQVAFAIVDPTGRTNMTLLHVRSLDATVARAIAGTEGVGAMTWSPDGRELVYGRGGTLMRLDVASGRARAIAENVSGQCAWGSTGTILCADTAGVLGVVGASSTQLTPLMPADRAGDEPMRQSLPSFLPDGDHFLYLARRRGQSEGQELRIGSVASRTSASLMPTESMALYAPPGYLLFTRGTTLFAQRFDADTHALHGEAISLGVNIAVNSSNARIAAAVSNDGTLIFRADAEVAVWNLTWFTRKGERQDAAAVGGRFIAPALSPDGKRVAFLRIEGTGGDIWIADVEGKNASRFTFDSAQANASPIWSPDGSRIAFRARRHNNWGIYEKPANGFGTERLIIESSSIISPMAWSPDGAVILYMTSDASWDIHGVDVKSGKTFDVRTTRFHEGHPQFSPDGRWLAYASNESGVTDVYVEPFPNGPARWQVSTGGGHFPRWSGDGKELVYWLNGSMNGASNASPMMSVDVKVSGQALEFSAPRRLFETGYIGGPVPGFSGNYQPWAMTNDAQRFLVAQPDTAADVNGELMTVVLNWPALLTKPQ